MARTRPQTRLTELVETAADVFIQSRGYRRAQMEEFASRLGVSKGTLYLYVQSKEALFDLALRFADHPDTFEEPGALPVPTPESGATLAYVNSRMASDESFLAFASLATAAPSSDAHRELVDVIHALYNALYHNRRAVKLVDTCAADHPELGNTWYEAGRGGIASLLLPFIQTRVDAGHFAPVPDPGLAARYVLENCVFWAIHLHWDPHPESHNHERIEDTLIHFLVRGLVNEAGQ